MNNKWKEKPIIDHTWQNSSDDSAPFVLKDETDGQKATKRAFPWFFLTIIFLSLLMFWIYVSRKPRIELDTTTIVTAHTILESFSILLSFTIFLISWTNQNRDKGNNLALLGCAFFSAGILDIVHVLHHPGMKIAFSRRGFQNRSFLPMPPV